MFASVAPNIESVKIILENEAKVNARTRSSSSIRGLIAYSLIDAFVKKAELKNENKGGDTWGDENPELLGEKHSVQCSALHIDCSDSKSFVIAK